MEGIQVFQPSGVSGIINGTEPDNSAKDMLARGSGFHIEKEIRITGTGSLSANVLQLTGTVRVLNQWAEIMSIVTLNNLTNAYATLEDGATPKDLTADGLTLSGAPVGSWFTKDQVAAQPYSANIADECRVLETLSDRWVGRPFTITQKNGADTFIAFNLQTTDSPIDFIMLVSFDYKTMNGGTLAFL